MNATVISDITPRGYELRLMLGTRLIKGAIIKQRLKSIIIQDRWEQQAKEINNHAKEKNSICGHSNH